MATVVLTGLGTAGIEKDIPSHLLPPEVWSNGLNFRMQDGHLVRFLGHSAVMDPPETPPGFIMAVPGLDESAWLYADLAAVYGYIGGVHADVSIAGGYAAEEYRDWNGCNFGGIPIVNNGFDVPQWWSDINLSQDLQDLTDWPAGLTAKVVRNFGPFLVALNLKDGATLLPHTLQWSHPADPGTLPPSWDYTDPTRDAGRIHLTDVEGGAIVDGLLLGSFLVIYKERSTHLLRYVGGNNIFASDLLFNQGLLGARCAAIIDSGRRHVGIGEDKIFVHAGSRAIEYPIDRKNQRVFYADVDQDNKKNTFAFDNPSMNEAWLCYPQVGQEFPNRALVWNYLTGSQTFRDFDGMSASIGEYIGDPGPTWDSIAEDWDNALYPWNAQGNRRLLVASNVSDRVWSKDTGLVFGDTANKQAFLQRTGIAVVGKSRTGEPVADYQIRKLGKRIWPKIVGSDTVVQVRMGSQEEIDGTITWAAAKTFIPAQRYLDFEVNGRLLAVEMTTLNDALCRIDGFDLEYELLGMN
jgi:hypothetical protein